MNMTFEEYWNIKLKHLGLDKDVCEQIWNDSILNCKTIGKFESWWTYHSQKKHWVSTPEQAACWAWATQQHLVDYIESDYEQIAHLLDIDTTDINSKDLRTIIIDTLKSRKEA